jgi:hypothetical protein
VPEVADAETEADADADVTVEVGAATAADPESFTIWASSTAGVEAPALSAASNPSRKPVGTAPSTAGAVAADASTPMGIIMSITHITAALGKELDVGSGNLPSMAAFVRVLRAGRSIGTPAGCSRTTDRRVRA